MIARRTIAACASAVLAACATAAAQSPQQANLSYLFVAGGSALEHTRTTGDLRVVYPTGETPLAIDMATMSRRETNAVDAAGRAELTIRLVSAAVRVTTPAAEHFSILTPAGVDTIVDGALQPGDGKPIPPIRATAGRDGSLEIVSDGGDLSKAMAAAATALRLPARTVAIGERWTGERRIALPPGAGGLPATSLKLATESELRGLQQDGGRLVATIYTRADASADGGAGGQSALFVSRFDVSAGTLIESEGDVSIDMPLDDPAVSASAGGKTRLVGRMRFLTRVEAPGAQQQAPPATAPAALPSTSVASPAAAGRAALGPSRDRTSLSGREILRYFGSSAEQSCRAQCEADAACQGFTWVKPGGYRAGDPPVCYLMRSYASAATNACCIAATRDAAPTPTPAPSPTAQAGPDRAPGDQCWTARNGQFFREMEFCASSVLPSQGGASYGPKHLSRWSGEGRAWCEGANGPGVGETISVRVKGAVPFRRLLVANGYGKSPDTFRDNGRVKTLEIVAGGGVRATVALADRPEIVAVDLPAMAQDWFQAKIVDVYPGARFTDTCLSLLIPDFEYEEELLLKQQNLLKPR